MLHQEVIFMTQHPETSSGLFLPIRMWRLVQLLPFSPAFILIHNMQLSVIKRTDFDLTDIISQRPGQPSLHHAQYFASNDRRMSVIVKIYPPRTKQKNTDLRRFCHFFVQFSVPYVYDQCRHLHTDVLIGQSPDAELAPYLVISDCDSE